MTVSACLIVRDEAARIARCVETVAPYVDEVVVADTGSTDGTAETARRLGARVVEVPWRDDFAAARNAAHHACAHDWVLSVDADERVAGDREALRSTLAALDPCVAALSLAIDEMGGRNPRGMTQHRAVKVYRRSRGRWEGRVHEQVMADGLPIPAVEVPAGVLRLLHDGYADPETVAAKVGRNLRLAERALADAGCYERRVAALLDLGRTQLAAGRTEGVDTLEDVRATTRPGGRAWVWATDFLAWDALGRGDVDRAWAFASELADHGAGEQHLRPLAQRLLAGV